MKTTRLLLISNVPALVLMVWLAPRPAAWAVGNDNFANAWPITSLPYVTNSSNTDATREPGEPYHRGSTNGHTVWWRWTAPASGPIQMSTLGSSFRPVLGVYTGAAVNALTEVTSGRGNHLVNFIATGGTTYSIALDNYDACCWTNFTLSVAIGPPPPANDQFANATPLTGANFTVTGASNVGATKEPGEPAHAGNLGGKSLWWKWTAPRSGQFQLDTAGSTFDTLLAVYTGTSLTSLSLVASNDNSGGPTSLVTFTAVAGATYSFAVDGWEGREGNITMHLVGPTATDVLLQGPTLVPINNQFYLQFQATGPADSNLVFQASASLSQPTWVPLQTNTLTGAPLIFTDPSPATNAQRFFRARLQ